MRMLPLAALAAALALAGAAAAQEKTPTPAHQDPRAAHAETDTSRDGFIDHEEFHRRMVEVFYHGDADKNGKLSQAEFAVLATEVPFGSMDKNADGGIALPEFVDFRVDQFEEADTNGDERLSLSELEEFVAR
jgi:hypothetical protein